MSQLHANAEEFNSSEEMITARIWSSKLGISQFYFFAFVQLVLLARYLT